MECDVGLIPGQAHQGWSGKPEGGRQSFVSVTGKANIEPHDIGLQPADLAQQAKRIRKTIEIPAADHLKASHFRLRRWQLIGQDGQAEQRVSLKLPRDVKAVFV
jgi:hypothetical protein